VGGQVERSYKSILFEVLPAGISSERSTRGRLDQRGLFYACRRLYLAHPERPHGREKAIAETKKDPQYILEYDYFANRIIPDYERAYGEIEGLIRDVRGHLHEVHTMNDAHELGTEFVQTFEPPPYYYDKVLYVEKEGIAQGLVDEGLGERFDLAVIATKGYRTEAPGNLLHRFSEERYQVFILHDCDVDGFSILANLRDGNMRVEGLAGKVVDLGMGLADACTMGLLGEPATRQKKIPEGTVTLPYARGARPLHWYPTPRSKAPGLGLCPLRA
jgi:hypothetical protein